MVQRPRESSHGHGRSIPFPVKAQRPSVPPLLIADGCTVQRGLKWRAPVAAGHHVLHGQVREEVHRGHLRAGHLRGHRGPHLLGHLPAAPNPRHRRLRRPLQPHRLHHLPSAAVSYALAVNLTLYNPSTRVNIYYDAVDARLRFGDAVLAAAATAASPSEFYQRRKETDVVRVEFDGRGVAVDGGVAGEVEKEVKAATVRFEVDVDLRVRYVFRIFKLRQAEAQGSVLD
ncbi:hypothetical protein PR202_gb00475 [Eleusine coracana subsp. coracana]|uniref:Late embryogenesis abundant protein LEA-2 subgroup domain-containing protein n=1 Tax=Eleusine coracana subsp. coracana TaxID=191504 RepID=A0AAV5DUY0_ELECO|nr:hypothetical protein PR202_gb00475 [Eleusine coracana subsp. coracana]